MAKKKKARSHTPDKAPDSGISPTPSRGLVNIGILIGGAIGLVTQAALNLDNMGAFLLTGTTCLLAVLGVNIGWVIYRRRNQEKDE